MDGRVPRRADERGRIPQPARARAAVTRSDSGGRSPSARSWRVRRATGPAVRSPSGGSDGESGRGRPAATGVCRFHRARDTLRRVELSGRAPAAGHTGRGEIFHNMPYARLLRSLRHPTPTPRFRKRALFLGDRERCSDRSEARRRATASPKKGRGCNAGYLKMLSRGRSWRQSRAGSRTAVPLPDPLLRS